MKFNKSVYLTCTIALIGSIGVAHAQFKLSSLTGGSATTADDGTAADAQKEGVSSDALVRSFIASNQEILMAQKFLALAYGEKDKAALLQAESDALKSPGVGKDELKKAVDLSTRTNEELAAKQAEKTTLSEEEKKLYVQSLPHFARGVVGTKKLVTDAGSFGQNAKGSMLHAGLGAGMSKMKAGLFVAKATPGYSKSVFDTFRKTVSIGKSNGVKMPADATAALSGLD